MNSKLELRNEAVKLATNLEGVNTENVIEVSKKIENYILGEAELPESYNIAEKTKVLIKSMMDCSKPNTEGIKTIYQPEKTEA